MVAESAAAAESGTLGNSEIITFLRAPGCPAYSRSLSLRRGLTGSRNLPLQRNDHFAFLHEDLAIVSSLAERIEEIDQRSTGG